MFLNKKIISIAMLLGATTLLGATSPYPDENGMSTINTTTTASIMGYGVLITTDQQTGGNSDVVLNHTPIYAPDQYAYTTVFDQRYITRSDYQSWAVGTTIQVTLTSDPTNLNNLVNSSTGDTIPHTLTARMIPQDRGIVTFLDQPTSFAGQVAVSGTTTTSSLRYVTGADNSTYPGHDFVIRSTIGAGGYWDSNTSQSKPVGSYQNISTFSAQISQYP